ncbi:MAG: ribosome maturation factor RimP [Gammaproteobacteria bacterium]|nr:ribosome maturation factor RimP [Gammaproteobacteria bacterium]
MKNEIAELIKPTILSMGYELWGLNVGQQNNSLKFTLYIDSVNGINIDDCEKVSNQVTHLLDTEEVCGSEYILEVSSPGFDRVLITKDHFNRYLKEKVKVKLKWLVNNRKNIKGVIKNVTDDYVIIDDENESYEIKYDSIDSARLKI